jgi:hypothetical protein
MSLCTDGFCWLEVVGASCYLVSAILGFFATIGGRPIENVGSKLQFALSLAMSSLIVLRFVLTSEALLHALVVVVAVAGVAFPLQVAESVRSARIGTCAAVLRHLSAVLVALAAFAFFWTGLQSNLTACVVCDVLGSAVCVLMAFRHILVWIAASPAAQPKKEYMFLDDVLDGEAKELVASWSLEEAEEAEEKQGKDDDDDDEAKEENDEEEVVDGETPSRFLLRLVGREWDLVLGALFVGVLVAVLSLAQSFLWGEIVALVSGSTKSSSSYLLRLCMNLAFVVLVFSA